MSNLTKKDVCALMDHIFVPYKTDEARCARCGMVFVSEERVKVPEELILWFRDFCDEHEQWTAEQFPPDTSEGQWLANLRAALKEKP